MGVYYVHKATRSRKVPYSFQCEHCLKDSGQLFAEISATVEENSHYKTLREDKQARLNQDADKKLGATARDTYKNITEKQVFPEEFKDECPHCKKPQSWSIAAAKGNALSTVGAILVVGAIICAGVYFTQGQNLLLTLVIGGAFVVGAVGYATVKAIAITAKKRKAGAAVQKNLPSIQWAALQDLLGPTNG